MKKGQADRVFACIGAVVGAGFASGRELMTFFSRYGNWSWALIALSAFTMAALCGLWMRLSGGEQGGSWCAIYRGGWMGGIGKTAQLLLLSVTGGAMLSAGGELIALVLPLQGAQWLGLALTLTLAFVLAMSELRSMAGVSGAMTFLILVSYLLLLALPDPASHGIPIRGSGSLVQGVVFALGYSGLNIAIALGVICECADSSRRMAYRTAVLFGLAMTALMFMGNYLLLQHGELQGEPLPMVRLLRSLGRAGYALGASVLYLAVLTTLTAILRSLFQLFSGMRNAVTRRVLPLVAPVLLALIGFREIVGSVYPYIGLLCLATLAWPLIARRLGRR